jgi:acetylornithine deacetylase
MSDEPMTNRTISLLNQLVALPSVNPVYDPTSAGEIHVARFIERWADNLGLCVEQQAVFEGRHNVIVRIVVGENLPTLLFESHMDTVSIVEGTRGGFAPTIDDGNMYGRGTCDTKGSMAAMMTAIERLLPRRSELACNIEFLAAVDEETSGGGARFYAVNARNIDAAVVGEPTSNRVVNRHKGVVRGEITVTGRAAHTSIAHEGVNAIDGMADVIVALREVSSRLGSTLEGGSLTVSVINGGTGINIVPEQCSILYDRRIVPGESRDDVLAEIDVALDAVRNQRSDVTITRPEPRLSSPPLDTHADSPILRAAIEAATRASLDSDPVMVPYGSDASRFSGEAGIDSVVFGPGSIDVAHGADEHVPLAELEAATNFYEALALTFGTEYLPTNS